MGEMEKCVEYRDGDDRHIIYRYPGGCYYNHYSVFDHNGEEIADCFAGGYETLTEARRMMAKHRPQAQPTSKIVRFPVYFEVVGYHELELPDYIDAENENDVKEFIAEQWSSVPLPDDFEYVGECDFDWHAPIEIL